MTNNAPALTARDLEMPSCGQWGLLSVAAKIKATGTEGQSNFVYTNVLISKTNMLIYQFKFCN